MRQILKTYILSPYKTENVTFYKLKIITFFKFKIKLRDNYPLYSKAPTPSLHVYSKTSYNLIEFDGSTLYIPLLLQHLSIRTAAYKQTITSIKGDDQWKGTTKWQCSRHCRGLINYLVPVFFIFLVPNGCYVPTRQQWPLKLPAIPNAIQWRCLHLPLVLSPPCKVMPTHC